MIILSIETSCDDTSISVIKNEKILSNIIFSQIEDNDKGIIPSIASNFHISNIYKVFKESIKKSNISYNDIDYISYTSDPGMIICLEIGKIFSETLSLLLRVPLIPCNHLIGHLYSSLINKEEKWKFPALGLVISGGHTQLYEIKNYQEFNLLGYTLDDAVGECLDKISIYLGYSYPGGPIIENLALGGKPLYNFSIPKNDNSLDFSFSGLKTQVRKTIEKEKKAGKLDEKNLSFSLQLIIAKTLLKKINCAFKKSYNSYKSIVFGGGVSVNNFFRNYLEKKLKENRKDLNIFFPEKEYCTDNASMIAIYSYYKIKKIY